MNEETKLKIFAYLDGQLSGSESAEARRLIEQDAEAAALEREWRRMKRLFETGEISRAVPTDRERYWADITRGIGEPKQARDRRGYRGLPWWLRVLAPATAGLAIIAALLLVQPKNTPTSGAYAEIDSPLDDVGGMVFHSDAAQMTIVWVDTR